MRRVVSLVEFEDLFFCIHFMRRVVLLVDFDDPEVVTMTYLFCNDNSSSHYPRHKGVNSALIKIRVLCCDILQSFNFKTYVIER